VLVGKMMNVIGLLIEALNNRLKLFQNTYHHLILKENGLGLLSQVPTRVRYRQIRMYYLFILIVTTTKNIVGAV
jgi:hypothetical protein